MSKIHKAKFTEFLDQKNWVWPQCVNYVCELITNSRDMNNNNSRKSWEQDVEDDLFKVVNNFITWASCSTFEFFKGPKLGVWFESFDSTIQLLIVSLRQAAGLSVFLWCQDWCSLASLSSEKTVPKINCLFLQNNSIETFLGPKKTNKKFQFF